MALIREGMTLAQIVAAAGVIEDKATFARLGIEDQPDTTRLSLCIRDLCGVIRELTKRVQEHQKEACHDPGVA